MTLIVERGIEQVRISDVGRYVGMSPGHVLYYFGTRERILLETLRWSESELAETRAAMLRRSRPGWPKFRRYVDLSVAIGPSDPRWTLWLEAYKRMRTGEIGQELAELDARWQEDLASVVTEGIVKGSFAPIDVEDFSLRFVALLDGFSLLVLEGARDRRELIETAVRSARIELDAKG
jgi:AcrR family transcriptional regulator